MLNLSIRTHIFPRIWKCAKVSSLFKAGDPSNPTNYRPISVLPTLAKILEKTVHIQLYNYLNTNKLITDKQFGFRSIHSTAAALTDFTGNVLHGMDKGKFCGAVFLDLTKAFDSVDHQLLFRKLSYFNISSEDIIWFKSYIYKIELNVQFVAKNSQTHCPYPMVFHKAVYLALYFLLCL